MTAHLANIHQYVSLRLRQVIRECEDTINTVIPLLWELKNENEYVNQIGKVIRAHRIISLHFKNMITMIESCRCNSRPIVRLVHGIESIPYYCDPSRYHTDKVRTIMILSMSLCGVIINSKYLLERID